MLGLHRPCGAALTRSLLQTVLSRLDEAGLSLKLFAFPIRIAGGIFIMDFRAGEDVDEVTSEFLVRPSVRVSCCMPALCLSRGLIVCCARLLWVSPTMSLWTNIVLA